MGTIFRAPSACIPPTPRPPAPAPRRPLTPSPLLQDGRGTVEFGEFSGWWTAWIASQEQTQLRHDHPGSARLLPTCPAASIANMFCTPCRALPRPAAPCRALQGRSLLDLLDWSAAGGWA